MTAKRGRGLDFWARGIEYTRHLVVLAATVVPSSIPLTSKRPREARRPPQAQKHLRLDLFIARDAISLQLFNVVRVAPDSTAAVEDDYAIVL